MAGAEAYAQTPETRPAPAQTRPPLVDFGEGVTFEISPHTGLMGSSGTFGLKMLMNYSALSLELAGEQVIGKTANLYPISLNIILNLSTRGRLLPYGAVGAGLFLTVPTNALGAETVSTLGINFGGGARYFITRNFGVRLEGKQYITTVSNGRDLKDELLFFQEVSLGVTFLFR
jgi:opacity protein-like surface antigen